MEVTKAKRARQLLLPGFKLVFRATRTVRGGRVLYAKTYGLRGWPMVMPDDCKP